MLRRARDKLLANHPTTCSPYRLLFLRHSIISNSSQCHFPKLPPFSFTSQVASPKSRNPIKLVRTSPPPQVHTLYLRLFQPIRHWFTSADGGAVGFCAWTWSPPPFSCLPRERGQAKCILPGDVFLPAGCSSLVESEAVQADGEERCKSLFKGRAVADAPRLPDCSPSGSRR